MYPDVSNVNSRELHRVTDSMQSVIAWCREQGLLATRWECHVCGAGMIESADAKRNDGVHWRCHECNCRKEASIRDGSFFGNGAKLELAMIVDLMYLYLYEMALHNNLMHECRIASEAIANWRNSVRDIYAEYFVAHPLRIGGPGHVVEIDELVFV